MSDLPPGAIDDSGFSDRDKWITIAIATVLTLPGHLSVEAFARRSQDLEDESVSGGELAGVMFWFLLAVFFFTLAYFVLARRSRRAAPLRFVAAASLLTAFLFFLLGPLAAPLALPVGGAMSLRVDGRAHVWPRAIGVVVFLLGFTLLIIYPVLALAYALLLPFAVSGAADYVVDRRRSRYAPP